MPRSCFPTRRLGPFPSSAPSRSPRALRDSRVLRVSRHPHAAQWAGGCLRACSDLHGDVRLQPTWRHQHLSCGWPASHLTSFRAVSASSPRNVRFVALYTANPLLVAVSRPKSGTLCAVSVKTEAVSVVNRTQFGTRKTLIEPAEGAKVALIPSNACDNSQDVRYIRPK